MFSSAYVHACAPDAGGRTCRLTVLAHVPARVPAVPMQVKDLSLMELGATLALAAALWCASSSCSLLRRLKVYLRAGRA